MAKKNDPMYVTDLGNRLIKAKAEYKRLQDEWNALWVETNSKEGQDAQPERITLAVKITQFLDNSGGKPYTSDQVAEALNLKPQSTATVLSKLVREGAVAKVGNDQYTSKLPVAENLAEAKEIVEW